MYRFLKKSPIHIIISNIEQFYAFSVIEWIGSISEEKTDFDDRLKKYMNIIESTHWELKGTLLECNSTDAVWTRGNFGVIKYIFYGRLSLTHLILS